MLADTVSVTVHIMDKEYQITCQTEQKNRLIKAAVTVDDQMRRVKNGNSRLSSERAAVLAALNLADDLQDASDQSDVLSEVSSSIINMNSRIDRALNDKKTTIDETQAPTLLKQGGNP